MIDETKAGNTANLVERRSSSRRGREGKEERMNEYHVGKQTQIEM